MKSPYVNELQPEQIVHTTFLVNSKEIRQKKSGEPYLSLTLADRGGDLDAKMWDNVAEVMDTFSRDDFVKVKGLLQIFHNRPQLTIHRIQRVTENEVDYADYFPASRRPFDDMLAELRGIISSIGDPHLRALLEAIFADEEITRRYKTAPAAKTIHHAWLGGLIEHVLSLCSMCRLSASHYKTINLDLLLTGAILHDIGKIYELSYDRGFAYTTDGQLLGHLMIGLRIVADKVALLPGFPPKTRTLVEHMIVSHHGRLEFGSPKLPQFAEAILLHYLDDLDSKMESVRALVEKDRLNDGDFTGYFGPLERSVLKMDRYLNPQAAAAAPPPSAPKPAPPPRPASAFGDKLLGALGSSKV